MVKDALLLDPLSLSDNVDVMNQEKEGFFLPCAFPWFFLCKIISLLITSVFLY